MDRKFWTADDVVRWIDKNVPVESERGGRDKDPKQAAIWWCCYRDTQALTDDTIRHIAQTLMDGIPPYSQENVTERVQSWTDAAGDEGEEAIAEEVDRYIEQDLCEFFQVKQKEASNGAADHEAGHNG